MICLACYAGWNPRWHWDECERSLKAMETRIDAIETAKAIVRREGIA